MNKKIKKDNKKQQVKTIKNQQQKKNTSNVKGFSDLEEEEEEQDPDDQNMWVGGGQNVQGPHGGNDLVNKLFEKAQKTGHHTEPEEQPVEDIKPKVNKKKKKNLKVQVEF